MNTLIITRVNNGKLTQRASDDIRTFIDAHEGKQIEITLKKSRSKRSLNQNAYYWSAVIPIVQSGLRELGYILSPEETHEFLKEKFVQPEMLIKGDEFLGNMRRTTTTMTKTEFMDYIAEIQQFGSEILNIYIPDPEQQIEMFQ